MAKLANLSSLRKKATDEELAQAYNCLLYTSIFAGEDEVITFSHTAYSKNVFAKGAVQAAKFLKAKPAGLYDMSDVIEGA